MIYDHQKILIRTNTLFIRYKKQLAVQTFKAIKERFFKSHLLGVGKLGCIVSEVEPSIHKQQSFKTINGVVEC